MRVANSSTTSSSQPLTSQPTSISSSTTTTSRLDRHLPSSSASKPNLTRKSLPHPSPLRTTSPTSISQLSSSTTSNSSSRSGSLLPKPKRPVFPATGATSAGASSGGATSLRPRVIAASAASSAKENHGLVARPRITASVHPTPASRLRRAPAVPSSSSPPQPSLPTRKSTPSSLSASLQAARTPLRPRDGNVRPASTSLAPNTTTTTKTTRSKFGTAATMPPHEAKGNAARHQHQPVVARVGARAGAASGRDAPLTPKVASAGAGGKPQQAFVTTPLARRGTARDNAAAAAGGSGVGGGVVGGDKLRDEYPGSPVAPFLSNNITPRSGSRQSRVDSSSNTPTGTPVPDRGDWDSRSGLGLAQPHHGQDDRRQAADGGDSKFFYASDARSAQQTQQPSRPTSTLAKAPSFFYASGDKVDETPASPTSSVGAFTPVLGHAPEPFSSKFIYANGTPDVVQPPHPAARTASPASAVSAYSVAKTAPMGMHPGGAAIARPTSPVKNPLPAKSAMAQGGNRSQVASAPPLGPSVVARRKVSIDTTPRGHARHGSLDSISSRKPPQVQQHSPDSSPTSSPSSTPAVPAVSMAGIMQAAEDMADAYSTSTGPESQGDLCSPTKSTAGEVSDLVANARRERKVQDLEITNASLEAINRTLERQLRKQTAELRRYRRLSRSGRLSLASSAAGSRFPSTTLPSAQESGLPPLSDMDDSDAQYPDEEHDFDDSLSESSDFDTESSASGTQSPSARAARDAKRRQRDETRLQLDLSKHRQLLVDSQKMNQSLKRCLNWTEELIKEGQKALSYSVRVSDVELGGRVLVQEDETDDEGEGKTEVENEGEKGEGEVGGGVEGGGLSVKGVQDRDSGVDLPPGG